MKKYTPFSGVFADLCSLYAVSTHKEGMNRFMNLLRLILKEKGTVYVSNCIFWILDRVTTLICQM